MLCSGVFVVLGRRGRGRLQTSQYVVSAGTWADTGAGFGSAMVVVVLRGSLFGSTMERYVFAILGPGCVEAAPVVDALESVVLSSCSEERINGTRLRRIPAPKTRWSSRGRK